MLTVLIAEDDPVMRQVLKNAIFKIPNIKVIEEAGDGSEALLMFWEIRPQIVIIDIDLPIKNGIELAKDIFDISPWTYIIFCTGHAEYRDVAFEIYAYDYLVKPFKIERINQTINRIMAQEINRERQGNNSKTIDEVETSKLFRNKGELIRLEYDNIIFICRENRKTIIYNTGGKIRISDTLDTLEKQLEPQIFFRSHKGFIINLKKVNKVMPFGKYSYELIMKGTHERPLLAWKKLKKLEKLLKC